MAVIVFGGGAKVEVSGDAASVLASLASAERHERFALAPDIPPGYCPLEIDDGIIYVNPGAVALAYDDGETPTVETPTVEMADRRTLNDGPRGRARFRPS